MATRTVRRRHVWACVDTTTFFSSSNTFLSTGTCGSGWMTRRSVAHHNDFTSEGKNDKHTTAQGGMRHGKKGSACGWDSGHVCGCGGTALKGHSRSFSLLFLIPILIFLPSLCRS
ncbi:hypothetical protein SESBI_31660 [Sesbania bispinosa]|nr:hypothetical protein SESBI_31660 [Sesbania bispinosa]